MKKLFYISLCVFSHFAFADFSSAQWEKAKLAVANDIDALVGDTVNEGESEAYVLRTGTKKAPQVKCKIKSVPERSLEILLCEVTFRIKPYKAQWTQRTCDLTYLLHINKAFPTLSRGKDSIFDRCIEILNEGE